MIGVEFNCKAATQHATSDFNLMWHAAWHEYDITRVIRIIFTLVINNVIVVYIVCSHVQLIDNQLSKWSQVHALLNSVRR